MTEEEAIKYEWKVLEIDTEARRARVAYVADHEDCEDCEAWVPVPFHKARDKDHAREMLEKKIAAYAPTQHWHKQIAIDESGDTETIATELRAELNLPEPKAKPKGKPDESNADAERG